MSARTLPLAFDCAGEATIGMLHLPERCGAVGVLIIVGGPQYRVGSHRQFVMLARQLAAAGYPVMRFDHRGIGDTGGAAASFEALDIDINAALAEFRAVCPGLSDIVLWGLCDGASAALLYASRNPGVSGLMLANPWAHSEAGQARAFVRHYYLRRLLQPSFWRKLGSGRFRLTNAVRGFFGDLVRASRTGDGRGDSRSVTAPLPARMAQCLDALPCPALLLLSENDLTAREFEACLARATPPAGQLQRVAIAEADHTFSREIWRRQVGDACIAWLASIAPASAAARDFDR